LPFPSAPWQLAQPAFIEISRPAAASGERSTGALDELEEHAPRIATSATTENFNQSLFAMF
jgi:ABC-type enterochelin transport system substrate-binding protein